jgi:hypothetical protein
MLKGNGYLATNRYVIRDQPIEYVRYDCVHLFISFHNVYIYMLQAYIQYSKRFTALKSHNFIN